MKRIFLNRGSTVSSVYGKFGMKATLVSVKVLLASNAIQRLSAAVSDDMCYDAQVAAKHVGEASGQ